MPDYLQAIRDCCRDEAAFERLKQILASAVKDEAFELFLGSLDSNLAQMLHLYQRLYAR